MSYRKAPRTFALRYSQKHEAHEVWKLFATDGSEHWIRQVSVPDCGRSPEIIDLMGRLVQIGSQVGQDKDNGEYLPLPDVDEVQEIVRKLGYAVERQAERLVRESA